MIAACRGLFASVVVVCLAASLPGLAVAATTHDGDTLKLARSAREDAVGGE
jgi:hypothetical protein